jgi:hypothetical protein
MKRTWLIVAAVAALGWAGCKGTEVQGEPQAGRWPHVECPQGSGVTAALRLSEIIGWAEADGTPKAILARGLAEVCATEHTGVNELHCQKVFQAWTFANQVVTNPELPPHEKEQLWQACADELTHESDGS